MASGRCDVWCRVKYLLDDNVKEVPLTFFQNWKEVETELGNNIIRETYEVFWSPNAEDTPDKVMERDGRILCIEKVMQTMVSEPPSTGYYSASLQNFADSRKELFEILSQRAGRRPLKPTQLQSSQSKTDLAKKKEDNRRKALNLRAAMEHTKHVFNNANFDTNVRQDSKRKSIDDINGPKTSAAGANLPKAGNKENVKPRVKRIRINEPKVNKVVADDVSSSEESLFTDGDGDEDDVPLVEFRDKVKEIENLKSKLKNCQSSREELQSKLKHCQSSQEALHEKLNKNWETKWEKAVSEWKCKWDLAQEKIRELEKETENLNELKKKIDDLEGEVARYRELNLWWQEQERLRKERSSSSRHSHSKNHSQSSRIHVSGNKPLLTPSSSNASPSLVTKSLSEMKKTKSNAVVSLFATPRSKDQHSSCQDDDPMGIEGVTPHPMDLLNDNNDWDPFSLEQESIETAVKESNKETKELAPNEAKSEATQSKLSKHPPAIEVDSQDDQDSNQQGIENEEVAFGIQVPQVKTLPSTVLP